MKLLQIALDVFADTIVLKKLNGKTPIFPSGFVQLCSLMAPCEHTPIHAKSPSLPRLKRKLLLNSADIFETVGLKSTNIKEQ